MTPVEINLPPALLAGFAGILGAIIGSFIATLCIRWPAGESAVTGRSRCDGCGVALGSRDLVPLVSALVSHGRCRTCAKPIDPTHWRVELAAAAIGVVALLAAPGLTGFAIAVIGWLALPLAVLDLKHFWLPDRLTAILAAMGVALGGLASDLGLTDRLIGGAVGFGALWFIAWAYRNIRKREGLGAGDPKLFGAIGLWTGWQMLPLILVAASVLGLVWALVAARSLAPATRVPLGAMLAVAAWLGLVVSALG